ncbi:hypothetical protein ACRE_045950 [Hapsidospora chrysogenum ATCC 11550]|uniref:Uncharacterized protein n=1 Tax=Hapsidospora chrysogenum (strain ATCC 11550 / CBS 779.69 / DSM 880 / IAM 14645 / JCM 23072 / IMI 49137) TaxID=857340 RepID=A0A086T5J1_HAPC1|nr:hypothetical protein ACRE_045950 [Hapsidospora chrysogenum ATCC 11550]
MTVQTQLPLAYLGTPSMSFDVAENMAAPVVGGFGRKAEKRPDGIGGLEDAMSSVQVQYPVTMAPYGKVP